jgi:hypothetical protein
MKNIYESNRTNKLVAARAKQCYNNAFRVVSTLPEYAEATYVEGLVVLPGGLLIEHGWVERDGEVIDPTLLYDGIAYFPGLRFRGVRGIAEAMTTIPKPGYTREDLPIFYRMGWGGADSAEFRAARDRAMALSNGLCSRSA